MQPRMISLFLSALTLTAIALAESPDISLKSASGDREFRLSQARGRYVALHFLMQTECPYCTEHVRDYAKNAAAVAGVEHLFIKPDPVEEVRAWAEKLQDPTTSMAIYHDADARLAASLGVPDGYAFHGQTVLYPALIVFGPDGTEAFRYVGRDNQDRLPFEKFAARMAEHSRGADVGHYNLAKGAVAISGHDPVAYFHGKVLRGDARWSSVYRDVTYHFADADSRAKFAASPAQYVPAYGGWCATAMAEGRKVEIDPANYQVTNGRLFLFYKGWLGDARRDWNKDEPGLTRAADEQWMKLAR